MWAVELQEERTLRNPNLVSGFILRVVFIIELKLFTCIAFRISDTDIMQREPLRKE